MSSDHAGRPPLPEGKAKGKIVQTRLSESERDLVERAASIQGVKLSHLVRERILAAAKRELRNQ